MDTASLSEIKKELQTIPQKVLIEHLLRVSKYKKENKELLSYLLFESHDEQGFISSVQQLMDTAFDEINDSNSLTDNNNEASSKIDSALKSDEDNIERVSIVKPDKYIQQADYSILVSYSVDCPMCNRYTF